MKYPSKERLIQEIYDLNWVIKKRCLLFGCVYGIEHVDKKPKDFCIFCGEKNKMIDSVWNEPSPHLPLNKAINKMLEKV